jgi:hypothetical protein
MYQVNICPGVMACTSGMNGLKVPANQVCFACMHSGLMRPGLVSVGSRQGQRHNHGMCKKINVAADVSGVGMYQTNGASKPDHVKCKVPRYEVPTYQLGNGQGAFTLAPVRLKLCPNCDISEQFEPSLQANSV